MVDTSMQQAIMMASSRADRRYRMRRNDALYAHGNARDRGRVMNGAEGKKTPPASRNEGLIGATWRREEKPSLASQI